MPKSDRSIILFTVVCVVSLVAILLACILLPRQGGDPTPTSSLAPEEVVAEYKGQPILASQLAQWRESYRLTGAQPPSDQELLRQLVENLVLEEEAKRRGLAATQDEIDDMVQSVKDSYELPEGKEILDNYCKDAGITLEQYFDQVREVAPSILARRKLETALGQEYCQEHGMEYTTVNPPEELTEAVDQAMEELVQAHADEIQYYLED